MLEDDFFPLAFPAVGLRVFSVRKGYVELTLKTCSNHLMRGSVCIYIDVKPPLRLFSIYSIFKGKRSY